MLERKGKGRREKRIATMYTCRAGEALRCDTNEGVLLIVKIFLVSSWAGQLFLMSSFLKDSIVYVAFLSSPGCLSLLILAMQFNRGEDTQDKELIETRRKIHSELKFSPGQDFPRSVLWDIPGKNSCGKCYVQVN